MNYLFSGLGKWCINRIYCHLQHFQLCCFHLEIPLKKMEKRTFKMSILAKPSKPLQNGKIPLYVRITLSGERTELSLNRSIHLRQWDNMKERARGKSPASVELNNFLDSIKNQLYICY